MNYKVTKFPHGTFSWADTNHHDEVAAKKYYAELMGWEIEDQPLGDDIFYSFLKKDGLTATAVGPMMDDMKASGMPSVWNNYVTVDDADKIVEKSQCSRGYRHRTTNGCLR